VLDARDRDGNQRHHRRLGPHSHDVPTADPNRLKQLSDELFPSLWPRALPGCPGVQW